ncbi:MAG: hypothetical protein DHS20C18_06910 [Saprospiraceae bacterium]|nr:MAG: hypothetical protein DHS20C18_06910 [Saprospiraceae bacterium]
MEHTKPSIREMIAAGKLEAANTAALAYAEYCGLPDIANALAVLSNRAKTHREQWNSGLISYEDFSLTHAQIAQGLAEWVERLPEKARPASRRRKLLDEATFKKRIFYLLIAIKFLVLLRLVYHWSTGGFTNDQFQATAALLTPTLAAYISVMLADYLRQQRIGIQPPRYISGPLVTFSIWLFPIYAIMLLLFIELKAKSSITFSQMNLWLALVESILGGYIGQIVFDFFRRQDVKR